MAFTRRAFVKGDASVVPASVAMGALNYGFAFASAADFENDVDVLNFALTLEYLEAEFYRQGNSAGLTEGKASTYLQQIQVDEESHVATLTETITALGGTPVAAPAVEFDSAFDSVESYLTLGHTFENTGVSAYLGAAGFISDKMILAAAAGIFGVEARHAAILGILLELPAEGGVYMGAFETPLDQAAVLEAVSPFIVGADAMGDGAAVTY